VLRLLIEPSARQWTALKVCPHALDDYPIVTGALPPTVLIELAIRAADRGSNLRWNAPRLLVLPGGHSPRIVASGGFKGDPLDGRVEIGYGTAESERGQGHATWMAQALREEALAQPGVREVLAESAIDNAASEAVLRKAGFEVIFQRADLEDGVLNVWRFR
jgi:[ribosomal protein S5]-alanine N-acetyltransferase